MKILHIVPSYLPAHRYGGPVESVHSLNVALVRAGHEVTVYTTNIDGERDLDVPVNEPVMKDGVRIFYFKASFPRGWFYSSEMRRTLAAHIKEFDIVHITSVFLAASTLGAYYAKKFKIPYIISPRGSLMRAPLAAHSFKKKLYISFIEKRNLKGASAIHFTVPAEEAEYRSGGFPVKKAFVVPNSVPNGSPLDVDKEVFRGEWHIPNDNKIVLFLGRISPIKGLDTLIPAFSKVAQKISDVTLVIVGGDDRGYLNEIKKLVEANALSEKVVFTGMLMGKEKEVAYRNADVFVVPSVSESFGMSAVEAMREGIATILTDGVGIADAALRANAAVVIKKDTDELANAIVGLLEDRSRREELGRNAMKFVDEEYSEASVAKKMEDAYRQVIEVKR